MLVVSRGWKGYGGACPPPPVPGVKLICFDPDPPDTRGRSRELSVWLAKQYHWSSVVLVATRTHTLAPGCSPAKRCFGGSTYVVTASLPVSSWPYQIAYGWGALLKALVVHRTC